MNLSKSFLLGALSSFFGLLFITEIALRCTVPTGFWYRHFDFSGDMTSLAELKDRIRYGAPTDHRVLLFGDSVLGASALMEHRIPEAREKTLSHFLNRWLDGSKFSAEYFGTALNGLSLGSDGMLLTDIEGLAQEAVPGPDGKVILLLNFRMFSKEFNEGPKALSRNFLLGDLPDDVKAKVAPAEAPSQESQLSDRLYARMAEHWFLFRETQMAKTLWYYPSQKDFFQRFLERLVGKNDTQSEIVEAALKQKIASYYQPYFWEKEDLPLACLKRVLNGWTANHVPVIVVLTPQNKKFLGSYLDKPSFEKNRKTLATFMKPYLKRGITYQDWADKYPASAFLDHCHMTPEGNQLYAEDLTTLLAGGKP